MAVANVTAPVYIGLVSAASGEWLGLCRGRQDMPTGAGKSARGFGEKRWSRTGVAGMGIRSGWGGGWIQPRKWVGSAARADES